MTTKTILITGGAGYIGSHAAKLYSKSGYKVIVLDNLSRGHKEFIQWGEFYLGDIGDKNILEKMKQPNRAQAALMAMKMGLIKL